MAGFCYGGGSALRYAAKHPGSAKAVGVFYGRPLQVQALSVRPFWLGVGFRVWGLWGLGFWGVRVKGLGFGVWGVVNESLNPFNQP